MAILPRVSAAAAALLLCAAGTAGAAEPPGSTPLPTMALWTMTSLTPAERDAALRIDALTLPTPGELFAAIGKTGSKPSWASQYRPPISANFPSRYQTALNLGALIADGFIAVEAQDGQQVKNIGRDIVALAKTLGVSESVVARGKSITDFAENNEWGTLKEELEATQNEVKLAMAEQRDENLVTLVSTGAWVRGTEVVSGVILAEYSPQSARLLRQPAIVAFLRSKLETLPPRIREDATVAMVTARLADLEKLVGFPIDNPPAADGVRAVNEAAAAIVRDLAGRKQP
jgi:hypothetical protein